MKTMLGCLEQAVIIQNNGMIQMEKGKRNLSASWVGKLGNGPKYFPKIQLEAFLR